MPITKPISLRNQYLIAIVVPVIVGWSFFLLKFHSHASIVAFFLLFLLSILAMFFELKPVLLTAFTCAFIWDFLFLKPQFGLLVESTDDLIRLLTFFIVALLNGVLTHKIRKAEKLLWDKEEKENILKLYNTLFSSLSHELRTPVTTISGCTQSLISHGTSLSEKDRKQLLNEILSASFRLNQQINNLLNMSRLESGFLKIRKDWCDIRELAEQVVDGLKYKFGDHHVTLNIQRDLPMVSLDFGLIQQVLLNLLNNALLYTQLDSSILITIVLENNHLILTVEDNGPGIPEAEMEKAFDKFFRGKNALAGGTGLGLSIVKGYTEAHQGTVSIKKSDMGGAEFIVNIPVSLNKLYETS